MKSYNTFEDIPNSEIHLPRVNNGVAVFVFDSVKEHDNYLSSLKVWNKESYCNEVNEAHNALFRELYTQRDYLAIGEIPIWESDTEFGEESKALQQWWIDTCKVVADYLETVTEETAMPVEDFISSLPKFDN